MRKIIVSVMAMLLLALAAAPAYAQARDPFDPLVEESATGGAPAAGAPTEERSATEGTETETVQTAEGMPNTGSNTDVWLVIAYVLLALGGAALAASTLLGRAPHPRHSPTPDNRW